MKEIVLRTADYVKSKLEGEGSGHDWWHTYRVWNLGKQIAISENANLYVVELACLLHDIADWKFNKGEEEETIGPRLAGEYLQKYSVEEETINHVKDIIFNVSFKGANVENGIKTLEGKCVQDADRLDAIGAIGIGRTFAYGGYMGREMYNPNIKSVIANSFDEYKKNGLTTINHFYEKLLLVKDRMNTLSGRKLAEERHFFMENFLKQFFKEWEGDSNDKNKSDIL